MSNKDAKNIKFVKLERNCFYWVQNTPSSLFGGIVASLQPFDWSIAPGMVTVMIFLGSCSMARFIWYKVNKYALCTSRQRRPLSQEDRMVL